MLFRSNAAPISGPYASTHSTGATIDIGLKKMASQELVWIRARVASDEKAGFISNATEEHEQRTMHIMTKKRK